MDDHYVFTKDLTPVELGACPDCHALILAADQAAHRDWHSRARVNALPTTPAALPEPGQPA